MLRIVVFQIEVLLDLILKEITNYLRVQCCKRYEFVRKLKEGKKSLLNF